MSQKRKCPHSGAVQWADLWAGSSAGGGCSWKLNCALRHEQGLLSPWCGSPGSLPWRLSAPLELLSLSHTCLSLLWLCWDEREGGSSWRQLQGAHIPAAFRRAPAPLGSLRVPVVNSAPSWVEFGKQARPDPLPWLQTQEREGRSNGNRCCAKANLNGKANSRH